MRNKSPPKKPIWQKLTNQLKIRKRSIMKKIPWLFVVIILVFTSHKASAIPSYENFENGIATTSFFGIVNLGLTATDEWGNQLQNNGAGIFYSEVNDNYLIKIFLEIPEEFDYMVECLPEGFGFFGNLYNEDNIFLNNVNLTNQFNEFLTSAELGTDTYFLIGGLEFFGYSINMTETSIEVVGVNPVPEPPTILLFGFGLLGFAKFGRKKQFK